MAEAATIDCYRLFTSSHAYHQLFAHHRRALLAPDPLPVLTLTRTIARILTHRHIRSLADVALLEGWTAPSHCSEIELDEFSKLLALRFVRENYFDAGYAFMTAVEVELTPILLKIAMFRKESREEERGSDMFSDGGMFLPCGKGPLLGLGSK